MEHLAGICGSVVRCDIFKSFFLEAQTSIVIEEIYIINKLDHSIKRLAITMAGRPAGRPAIHSGEEWPFSSSFLIRSCDWRLGSTILEFISDIGVNKFQRMRWHVAVSRSD